LRLEICMKSLLSLCDYQCLPLSTTTNVKFPLVRELQQIRFLHDSHRTAGKIVNYL
jgi:hypothetical protein